MIGAHVTNALAQIDLLTKVNHVGILINRWSHWILTSVARSTVRVTVE